MSRRELGEVTSQLLLRWKAVACIPLRLEKCRESPVSSQKRKSPELTSAHPSDMVTTPQGAHNLRRQDILGRLEFLGNKFTGLT